MYILFVIIYKHSKGAAYYRYCAVGTAVVTAVLDLDESAGAVEHPFRLHRFKRLIVTVRRDVDDALADHLAAVGNEAAAEAVGEDLIADALAVPGGPGTVVFVDRELPGAELPIFAEALPVERFCKISVIF